MIIIRQIAGAVFQRSFRTVITRDPSDVILITGNHAVINTVIDRRICVAAAVFTYNAAYIPITDHITCIDRRRNALLSALNYVLYITGQTSRDSAYMFRPQDITALLRTAAHKPAVFTMTNDTAYIFSGKAVSF